MKALRLVSDPVKRAEMTEETALDERRKALEWVDRAKLQFTEAVEAGMRGDSETERLTRDALAAQENARKQLSQAEATLAAIRDAKAKGERQRAAAATEERWQQATDLCKQREKAAERAQRAAVELGRAWAEMMNLQQQIIGATPLIERASRLPGTWAEGARAAIEGQLFVASEGGLAPNASGFYTLSEFKPQAIDVPSRVKDQHRRVLMRENGKPVLQPQGDPDGGPAAA